MNGIRIRKSISIMMVVILLVLPVILSAYPVVAQTTEVPRDKTLWGTGYHPHPTSFIPCVMDWGQGWDTYIMYEPMFGTDVATGDLIYWLGESIEWIDSTTIEVVLRDGIEWTDGNPITSTDVKYSFYLFGGFTESTSGGRYWHMGGFRERVGSLDNFEIIDDSTFRIHISASYPYSNVVWRTVTQSFLIFPKHVWIDEVNATYGDIQEFANDWQDPSTPEAWKVASGMYLPMWHDDVTTIMQRNDDWWGNVVFGRLPAPEYFGYITYDTNPPAALALEKGELDWCGKYVPGIDVVKQNNPNLETYFDEAPYFADKSAKLLAPNHRRFPLNEPWLHKVISLVMDFTAFNAITSNYLKPASPLFIPADDAIARRLLNETIEDQFALSYDLDAALDILDEYCIQDGGDWYTKDGPSAEYYAAYSDVLNETDFPDALPGEPGVNIKLGPWKVMDVYGWTDVNAIDVYAADQIGSLLGISVETYFPDFGTYISKMDSMDFDFVHYVMHYGMNSDMYQRYTQMFTGNPGAWTGNYGDFRNSTLVDLLDDLDTVEAGTTAEQAIANQMQMIIGEEMPIIPLAGHPDWYIYSTEYWEGWPNDGNPLLAASPYGGSSQTAQLHQIVFNLREATGVTPPPPIPGDILLLAGGGAVVLIVIIAGVVVYQRRR